MEPTRFDSLARSFAAAPSRRSLLKLAASSVAAGLWNRISGRPGFQAESAAAQASPCVSPNITCWDSCINPQTDSRNCGKCGEACLGGSCVQGKCVLDPDPTVTTCRAHRLRFWLNVFTPGSFASATSFALYQDQPRSVFQIPGNEALAPSVEPLQLLTDRSPTELDTFSFDINSRSLAHIEFELYLPEMRLDAPLVLGGNLVQVNLVQEQATAVCSRSLGRPFRPGGGEWQTPKLSPDGNVLEIAIDAAWGVGRSDVAEPGCRLDSFTFPIIQVQGKIQITRIDTAEAGSDAYIEVKYIDQFVPDGNGLVSAFPAFEMYAALDDGNLAPVFRQSPSATVGWFDLDESDLIPVTGEGAARFPCICRGCQSGKTCSSVGGTTSCEELSGYFVLAGGEAADLAGCAGGGLDDCQAAWLDVGDALNVVRKVQVPASSSGAATIRVEQVYDYDTRSTRAVPPVGFLAKTGDVIEISARRTVGTNAGIAPFVLYRMDSTYLPLREVFRSTGIPFGSVEGESGVPFFTASYENRSESLRNTGTICCADGAAFPCTDHRSDQVNCGGCGHNCANDQVCLGGECHCPYPLEFHNGACIDPMRTNDACGPFFEDCTDHNPPEICVRAECVRLDCDPGFHICDDICASDSSATMCGADCRACPDPPQSGIAACFNGVCGVRCDDGFHACFGQCMADDDIGACGPDCVRCEGPGGPGQLSCVDGQCTFEPARVTCDDAQTATVRRRLRREI